MTYHLKIDLDRHGERWAMLFDAQGMPLFYPTLYNTTTLRGGRKSTSTQEQHLTAIKVLYEFCDQHGINLVNRIQKQEFLATGEIEGLSNACRAKKRGVKQSKVVSLKKGFTPPMVQVEATTHYIYLNAIAAYVKWLCETLLGTKVYTTDTARAVKAFLDGIKSRGVTGASKAGDDGAARGLTTTQTQRLMEITMPGSPLNPWRDPGVQIRNFLIVRILLVTGCRIGEVLNIRADTDIDWETSRLCIIRRADSKKDTRKKQPKVKTEQREIPLAQETVEAIQFYIRKVRKQIPNINATPYLFVTHKSGPTQGKALSLQAATDLYVAIREADPTLDISAHDQRHTWHHNFSKGMKTSGLSHEEIEALRRFLAGWKPGSTQAEKTYDKVNIREQAYKAQLALADARDVEIKKMKEALKTNG
ncbi:MAG: site-specific integrase [Sulfuritalea sp.]|nr:site-specific integrase [Sulfuritalea sp.]